MREKTKQKVEQRSATMRAVKSYDTSPELAVRRILRLFAPRYRLHRSDLPGKPDIVYVGKKHAIFVHGCFWHGHSCARGARIPKTNVAYWSKKISRNRQRDINSKNSLKKIGWRSIIIWECELKDQKSIEARLRRFLL